MKFFRAFVIAFVFMIGLLLFGCDTPAVTNGITPNAVPVSIVAEYDGVRVYRFYIDARYIYVARIIGDSKINTSWDETNGRTVTNVRVDTLNK